MLCYAILIPGQTTHTSSNGGNHVAKKPQKNLNNYASVECGAKILSANPEAKVCGPNRTMIFFFPVGVESHVVNLVFFYLPEHLCHSHGEHGPIHAESLQQQDLVNTVFVWLHRETGITT